MGRWMDINGESIYGSTASPIGKPEWGRVTQNKKTNTLYLHVFDWPSDGKLAVEKVPGSIKKATLLSGNVEVSVTDSGSAVVLELPSSAPDKVASMIRFDLESVDE